MASEYIVVDQTKCGTAYTQDGGRVEVEHVKYDRPHVGTGCDFEFVVTRYDSKGQAISAAGFTDESSAWRYVTGDGEAGFEIKGQRGQVVRECLGIPDAFITGRVPSYSSAPDDF